MRYNDEVGRDGGADVVDEKEGGLCDESEVEDDGHVDSHFAVFSEESTHVGVLVGC